MPGGIAVLPLDNLSGVGIPTREVQEEIEKTLSIRGIPLVVGPAIDRFLARHRIRWTGGIDRDSAVAAGAELGVSGVLVTTLELYEPGFPPRVAWSMRLISADADAQVRWTDAVSRRGDDSPGFFDLGVITDVRNLQRTVLGSLGNSLAQWLQGLGPAARSCDTGGRFAPKQSFLSPALEPGRLYTVAVLPFANETETRWAGDLVALQFARQLLASGRFKFVEPGLLRENLLRFRIVMEGGVFLDAARVVLELTNADFVLFGYVREYVETGESGAPQVQFTVLLLDRKDAEVVWESTSYSHGDDGVFFFDVGLIATAPSLSCRMARGAVADLLAPPRPREHLSLPGPRR